MMYWQSSETPPQFKTIDRKHLQKLVFLLIWPTINLLITIALSIDVGIFAYEVFSLAVLRYWLIFGLSWLVISGFEAFFPELNRPDCFLCQLILHAAVIIGFGALFISIIERPIDIPLPHSLILPRIVVILEIVIYLIVLRLLSKQEQAFAASLTVKEKELKMLRFQSNPHFLFNTLNLITSEISEDPKNAKEIVFDLADLLRSNIKMAEKTLTPLADEIKLVDLYLTLQQKRFKERLTYEINVSPETKRLQIPALLLQPVVENTVKHAVAPYAAKAHIQVDTHIEDDKLLIRFKDSGPEFDDSHLEEGNGFRILRETLSLQYHHEYELRLYSTSQGGELTIRLPLNAAPIKNHG